MVACNMKGFTSFKCKQIHRYFGIMESLTFMNRDNQSRMLDYHNCEIVSSIFDLTHLYKGTEIIVPSSRFRPCREIENQREFDTIVRLLAERSESVGESHQ